MTRLAGRPSKQTGKQSGREAHGIGGRERRYGAAQAKNGSVCDCNNITLQRSSGSQRVSGVLFVCVGRV